MCWPCGPPDSFIYAERGACVVLVLHITLSHCSSPVFLYSLSPAAPPSLRISLPSAVCTKFMNLTWRFVSVCGCNI